jgi:hypothetical protein
VLLCPPLLVLIVPGKFPFSLSMHPSLAHSPSSVASDFDWASPTLSDF